MVGVTARLRQAVLVTGDLDRVAGELQRELALDAPFADDPYVAQFGLRNLIFTIGDQFLEVLTPVRRGTAAGRHLDRLAGDGGYMVLFEVDGLAAARERAAAADVRIVWSGDAPGISGMHLHPADLGGTIVSLDAPDPPGSWAWAGPEWTGRTGDGPPGQLTGVTVAVSDPGEVAARWAAVLGADAAPGVTFVEGDRGLVEVALAVPETARRGRDAVDVGGVRFSLAAA